LPERLFEPIEDILAIAGIFIPFNERFENVTPTRMRLSSSSCNFESVYDQAKLLPLI